MSPHAGAAPDNFEVDFETEVWIDAAQLCAGMEVIECHLAPGGYRPNPESRWFTLLERPMHIAASRYSVSVQYTNGNTKVPLRILDTHHRYLVKRASLPTGRSKAEPGS